jgi:hypothetical protein
MVVRAARSSPRSNGCSKSFEVMPAICEVVSGSERGGCKARHGSQTHRTKGDIFQSPRSVPNVQRCGIFRHCLTGSRRARYGPVRSASTMRSWKSLTTRVDDD